MKHDEVEELFKKYYNDLLLYAVTLTREKSLAEDIVAEAFFRALATTREVSNFKPWLFKVCRNVFITHTRRSKIYAPLNDELTDGETVVEKIITDEGYRALYRAIELLPDMQKEVITLFYFEDMKIKDIAEVIGKNTEYTKLILFRGREGIKRILEVKNGL